MSQSTRRAGRAKGKLPRDIPAEREVTLPPRDYQPTKAEQEKEYDMPEASLKTIRRAFLRPFNVKREGAK